jgi:hypothetical protein
MPFALPPSDSNIVALFIAAQFVCDLCPMPDAHSSLLSYIGAHIYGTQLSVLLPIKNFLRLVTVISR